MEVMYKEVCPEDRQEVTGDSSVLMVADGSVFCGA